MDDEQELNGGSGGEGEELQQEDIERFEIFARAVSASDLAIADRHLLCKWRSSDPYVEIKFKKTRVLSSVAAKTLNPEWEMQMARLGSASKTDADLIYFNVWDHDNNETDDFLGCVEMSVVAVCQKVGKPQSFNLPLADSSNPDIQIKKRIKVSGTLSFEIEVRAATASDESQE